MNDKDAIRGVDGVIITGELDRRPSRTPDYEAESRALALLAETMSSSPGMVLQRLVETAIELTRCDSAGISLLEPGGEQGTFRWVATAGAWAPYRDGTMPREASPCGEVIARESVLLMDRPERAFPALLQAQPGIGEGLLGPFNIDGAPGGTLWAIMHGPNGRFEAEDARLLESLTRFAAAAHQTLSALDAARAGGRESEARYRTLFESMDQGFCIIEKVAGAPGEPSDFRYLTANPAFERHTGLHDVVGKTIRDLVPDAEQSIMDIYDEVVRTGEHKRFEAHVAALKLWMEAEVFPTQTSGQVAVLFSNVSQRKQAETALHESEKRQTFLLKLADRLRPLADPVEVTGEATRLLGEELGASRAYYVEWPQGEDYGEVARDYAAPGLPSLAGRYPNDAFRFAYERIAQGRTWTVEDAAADVDIIQAERDYYLGVGVTAWVDVPLVKGGDVQAALCVVQDAPRRWRGSEVALIEDVAERCWAAIERGRAETALRDSELRLAAAFESVPVGAAAIDQFGSTVLANAEFRRFLPTDVIPSRDPERGERWRGWDAEGTPLVPTDFPGARAMRGERVVPGQEMLYTDDDGREIWTSVATVPIRKDGRVTGQVCVISDIDALRRSTQALRDSEARFRQFSDASTNILWIRDAVTLQMTFASPAFDTIYGIPGPDRGGNNSLRSWARLIEPKNRKAVLANLRRVRAGERIEMEFQFRRASDGALRWAHNTDFPLRDAAGVVRWIAGLGADITDSKEAADRQGVLVAELQHRTRNLIGVVRSLADRTLADAASADDFGKRFRPRLSALSRVQGLLSHLAAGERVTFDELLRSELTAHGATDGVTSKVTLDGPAGVPLRSGTVQTFALALHELATNAVKYGALAAPNGHLTVRWQVEAPTGNDPPRLYVEWQESGVVMPDVGAAPRGGGYGRELIERALPYQLKAKTSYEFGADGVRCTIAVPISRGRGEGTSE